jgi:orotidine-5'-phosphate decarboxylase
MTEARTAANTPIPAKDRLIIALDVDSADAAQRIVDETSEFAGAFKVGLQLFTTAGPEFVRQLCEAGLKVFLDLKFHDIPNTVAKAGIEAARLGVWMFNIHAAGGNEMMRRVVSEVGNYCENAGILPPKVIGVTVLTSSSDDALREIGIEATADGQVARLSVLAKTAGLDGVVASAREAASIRQTCGKGFLIVTPGIRPSDASNDDQQRVMTPAGAVRSGSDFLVVGRPITESPDMSAAAQNILSEISRVLNES